jgi:hypothetical protein
VFLGYKAQAGASFLFENSHHIRGLGFCTEDLKFFDVSRCIRLRTLRVIFFDESGFGIGGLPIEHCHQRPTEFTRHHHPAQICTRSCRLHY